MASGDLRNSWWPAVNDGVYCGGLAVLLREVLKKLGYDTCYILYEGQAFGVDKDPMARLELVIPADPSVPGSVEIRAAAFEQTFSRAVQTAAMRALRQVMARYRDRLEKTCFRYLPHALPDPGDRDAVTQLARAVEKERNETLKVTVRCSIEQEFLLTGMEERERILKEKLEDREDMLRDSDHRVTQLESLLEMMAQQTQEREQRELVTKATLQARIAMLEECLISKDTKIAALEEALDWKNEWMDSQDTRIVELEDELASLRTGQEPEYETPRGREARLWRERRGDRSGIF